MKTGKAIPPTIAAIIAPKTAPITKIKTPPAPPAIIPHRIPIKGKIKSITDQLYFSTSATIFAINFPEKYPTVAQITFTKNKRNITQLSSNRILEFIKNLLKSARGGNAPSIKPNQANDFSVESGFFIKLDSRRSCSVL